MASAAAEGHDDNLQQMLALQVEQLQEALRTTVAIATKQGCGVTVDWRKPNYSAEKAEMQVDMYVDDTVAVGDVRYREN